jgi:hypothetical protein
MVALSPTVSSPSATMLFIAWQGSGLRPLPYHFEHLLENRYGPVSFAVCHEHLRKLRHLGRLGYLGKSPKNLLFRAVNILQLRQNRSLSVFSTMGNSF